MSRISPLKFQTRHIDGVMERFLALRDSYSQLGDNPSAADLKVLRQSSACVMLQAPTGIGKTLMAAEVLAGFSAQERVLWLWFAPFAGVVNQTRASLKSQAPGLSLLDLENDRYESKLVGGAVFLMTWQAVATRSKDARLARQSGDQGLGVDELILVARTLGMRIGVVVDEAHHGFVKAAEASRFFKEVLQPDYVLLMTATPRDEDARSFSKQTGYEIGSPDTWASVPRSEGVDAELLKESVKAARFIARNQDDAQLVAFEEVAMSECAAMHRRIKDVLKEQGVGLVPLMLVQVPNGGDAIAGAVSYLTKTLGFSTDAVKSHSSDEPDPNLLALAQDPSVEVIVFKMAIATGFDAPRAFTLAALRGTRDSSFGVQVVGRIMRVHRLLQGRLKTLPALLRYGYVFLANSEAQEGLLSAAARINQMPDQLASAAPSAVVTVIGDEPHAQIVRPGGTLSLLPHVPTEELDDRGEQQTEALRMPREQPGFFELDLSREDLAHGTTGSTKLSSFFERESSVQVHRYPRAEGVPEYLVAERMSPITDDFEERLVSFIDFAPVLGDRTKVRTKLTERVTDVFSGAIPDDRDIAANVSPIAIAKRARQLTFSFEDADDRLLLRALKERFRQAYIDEGHELPKTEEQLTRELELVLVRNSQLLKNAHKRMRSEDVVQTKVSIPAFLESAEPLPVAKRATHRVIPSSLQPQEAEFAELLDTSSDIDWWYRNTVGATRSDSVSLYRWSSGQGFFPDFVARVKGRAEGEGIALIEVKGPHLQHFDRAKAGAKHAVYGKVFMVGKGGEGSGFRFWRLTDKDELVDDGPFEVSRLRYD